MNKYLKKFLERTIPLIVIYGVVVAFMTYVEGINGAIIAISTWALIDVFIIKEDIK